MCNFLLFCVENFVLNGFLFSFDGRKFLFPENFWHKSSSTDKLMTRNKKKDSLFYNFLDEFPISIWKFSCFFRFWVFLFFFAVIFCFYSFFVRTLNCSLSRMNLRCCLQNIMYSTYKKTKNQPPNRKTDVLQAIADQKTEHKMENSLFQIFILIS